MVAQQARVQPRAEQFALHADEPAIAEQGAQRSDRGREQQIRVGDQGAGPGSIDEVLRGNGFHAQHLGELAGVQAGARGGDHEGLQQIRLQVVQQGTGPRGDGGVHRADARVQAGRAGGAQRGDDATADAVGLAVDVLSHLARHHHAEFPGERRDIGDAERAQLDHPAAPGDGVGQDAQARIVRPLLGGQHHRAGSGFDGGAEEVEIGPAQRVRVVDDQCRAGRRRRAGAETVARDGCRVRGLGDQRVL
ncbi:hypothetical protein [Nocardia brasiliensis]|uniref:hypothetical protein n=1 Tax=Nocardia brasiliensis TaxID=37326 RepID=UPI0024577D36|nr:hypothetical protein [Nocardia brasiliensis]